MTYRSEIDGLRALAVVLVLLFHADIPFFTGGFIGVDVFFVISGYLIASLIRDELAKGDFSFLSFYERRMRRILPALVLVIPGILALSAFVLLPDNFAALASSAVASMSFLSNFYFLDKIDYFQDESGTLPLLHLWSLSVEGQFYLVAPLMLVFLGRFSKPQAMIAIGLLFVASLIYSTFEAARWPEAAFYSPASRFFEILTGVFLVYTGTTKSPSRHAARLMPAIGIAMILAASLVLDRNTHFPGLLALLPCCGAALVIAFAKSNVGLGALLSTPAVVYSGLVSYPLYLWHWPLLVLAEQFFVRELVWFEIVVVYSVALLLSVATYELWERPLAASWSALSRPTRYASAALAVSAVTASALAIWFVGGFPERVPPRARELLALRYAGTTGPAGCANLNRDDAAYSQRCAIGDKKAVRFQFALWGDSMANNLSPMVSQLGARSGVKGLLFTQDGCPPLLGVDVRIRHKARSCGDQNALVLEKLAEHRVRRIILVASWGWYAQGRAFKISSWPVELRSRGVGQEPVALDRALLATVSRLREQGIEVAVVGPIPEVGWSPPQVLAVEAWRRTKLADEPTLAEFLEWVVSVMPAMRSIEYSGSLVVYPHKYLCDKICRVTRDGRVFYAHPEHLTSDGLAQIRPALVRLFLPGKEVADPQRN